MDAPYMHVVLPDEQLNVSGHRYALAGFACHIGSRIRSGHYTAVMRNADVPGEWWFYDDARVMLAREQHRRTEPGKKVYLAFYEQEVPDVVPAAAAASRPDTPPPGSTASSSHRVVEPLAQQQSTASGRQQSQSQPLPASAGRPSQPAPTSRIAGFSSTGDVSHDILGERARWEEVALDRFRERDAEGRRGRRVDLWGNELDLGSGPVSLQPRRSRPEQEQPPER